MLTMTPTTPTTPMVFKSFICTDSNHKIAFDYNEDTMSLAEELTLDTSEVLLSDNTISSAGNATIAFEYHCYEIEADPPQFNYHGPKIKIPK
jgi:hypothetical protein